MKMFNHVNTKKNALRAASLLISLLMVVSLLPVVTFADETDTPAYVYLSVSFDKEYITDKNGAPMVYVPVPLEDIAAIDLTAYGLDNMLYDADGDGKYETTALQLLIYAHEVLWGGDWSEVSFDALPGSSYFAGGIFGFTENLVYFLNGDFPVDESMSSDWMTTGATSDRIVLEAGDFLDVASFGCYSFLWDQLGGFHLFADPEGNYVHDYEAVMGEPLSVKLKHSFCDLMFGQSWVKDTPDFEIFYGSVYGEAEGSVITDEEGNAEITFDAAGTYYVWCEGGIGSDDGTHGTCDQYFETYEPCVVSSPAYAKVTVTDPNGEDPAPDQPRQPRDVSGVLDATMAQLAATVTAPSFGTNAGEWTVFSLARGGYFAKDDPYFTDYYARIVETVNETAAKINKQGALDKNKSTENSRLIVALSAIGRDATSVGDWDLVEAYSANGINWIKKQGMNGTIWTLIALDSGNYETSDPTIRQQCVDSILNARHDDGGWSLVTSKTKPSNVDITCMTLTALYPYRDQPAVAAACAEAIEWLSASQLSTGGFPYGNGETSESCAWAIVALTAWGINPDTDERFIKDGISAVDNLLSYYLPDEAMFEHGKGAGSNAMATDQACYALAAYDRFINGEKALYDYSDVTFDPVSPATHRYEVVVTPPTCTEGGYTTYTCTTCPHTYTDNLTEASGHTPGDAPDCTHDQTCTVCGAVLSDRLGHDYTAAVTAPTCTGKGYTTNTCTRCGDSYTDGETSATGHTHGDWIVDSDPAPGVEGSKHKACTVCGEVLATETMEALPEETEAPTEESTEETTEESTEETEETTETPTEDPVQVPADPETDPATDPDTDSEQASEDTHTDTATTPEGGCASVIVTGMGILLSMLLCGVTIWRKREE